MELGSRTQGAAHLTTGAHVFESERRRLTLLAYRMCGSWADAEDVVQHVAIQWLQTSDAIENLEGWLTKVTVRRALDRLRARQRDTNYVGPWVPEPLVDEPGELPHEAAEHAEALSTAFLMLVEHLTPPQRGVVVLRALGYSHEEIGTILGISPTASRQHHTRSTRRLATINGRSIEDDPGLGLPSEVEDAAGAEQLLQAFLVAARQGTIDTLADVLHKDVQAFQDGGGKTRAARRILVGASSVARFTVGVAGLHKAQRTARLLSVNGAPGAVLSLSGVTHVLSIQVRDGRIYRLFDMCNPDKLGARSGAAAPRLALAG